MSKLNNLNENEIAILMVVLQIEYKKKLRIANVFLYSKTLEIHYISKSIIS